MTGLILAAICAGVWPNPFDAGPAWGGVTLTRSEVTQGLPLPAPRTWNGGTWRQVYVAGDWSSPELRGELQRLRYTVGETGHVRPIDPVRYGLTDLPAYLVADDDGGVLRQFDRGCGQPLDVWAIHWLATGEHRRQPASTADHGNYPVRGRWWSVGAEWSASRDDVLRHLRTHANHRGKAWQSWPLEQFSRAELHSLHSDDHEGRVQQRVVRQVRRLDVYCPT